MKISYSSLTVGDSRSHSAGGGSDELLLSSLMAAMCAGDPNLGDIAGEPVRKQPITASSRGVKKLGLPPIGVRKTVSSELCLWRLV